VWYEGGVRGAVGEKLRLEILPFLLVAQVRYDAELKLHVIHLSRNHLFPSHCIFLQL